jgi:alkanesulfonate monooxygenase SsuD/methylene tetrahydromethanopterin reductase-like flavin-dependent oxidoreductase (luciferase family)
VAVGGRVTSFQVSAKRGIFLAPFDELVDPGTVAELAARAEERGWDGFFLWDHVRYRAPVRAVADPWIVLSAIACSTERIRLGPMVTPLSRRRVQKVARETVTLDHLSRGRLTFGVGLGSDRNEELEAFGEVVEPRERAKLLDRGLDRLSEFWAGDFLPRPVQQPRIPVWVAARWETRRRPLQRAVGWDGVFVIELPGPEALGQLRDEVRELRGDTGAPFDFVVETSVGEAIDPWEEAGATWILTDFERQPRLDEVRETIDAGPR